MEAELTAPGCNLVQQLVPPPRRPGNLRGLRTSFPTFLNAANGYLSIPRATLLVIAVICLTPLDIGLGITERRLLVLLVLVLLVLGII